MTRPTLTVVGKGDAPDNSEAIAQAADFAHKLMEHVRAGGGWFALLDGDEIEVAYHGDALEIGALTEVMAESLKLSAMGLG